MNIKIQNSGKKPKEAGKISHKIMLVDDSEFMRRIEKNILKQAEYQIAAEAGTGKDAVEIYKKLRPELVLLDITLPDISGMQVLEEIKKEDPDALVIMCTAMGQEIMIKEALLLGATDFLIKPFQAKRLLQAITSACNSSLSSER